MSGFLGTIPGHTLEFFLDANHTQLISNPAAFENTIAATQTVFVVATNITTGCKSYRTLTIQVLPVPTPNTDLSLLGLEKCDDTNPAANDGYEVFDLTTNATYIINGDPNVTLHYYPSYNDAVAGTNEITTGSPIGVPTAANVNQNVWIRVESNFFIGTDGDHCYVLVEQPIKVNPLPLITANKVFQQCDDDTDGFTVFNLGSYANELLSNNPLPLSDYTLAFYLDAAQTIPIGTPNAYTNTNTTGNTQIIYVVATDVDTNCKSMVGQFTIMVNPKPTLTVPPPFSTCDDELNDNDGYYPYDLSLLIPNILGASQTLTDYEVNFYNSPYNPEATPALLPVAIADLVNYQAYTHTVWIAVKNKVTGCERIGFFSIIVEQKPTPVIVAPTNVICVDYNTQEVVRDLTLTATNTTSYLPGTPTVNYTYQWFDAGVAIPGATASTYVVATTLPNNDFTNYTVSMTSASALACNDVSPNFLVSQSGQAVVPAGTIGYTVTNAFSSNQTITIDVDGYGMYEFSLDEGPRQTSTVFENVSLGSHTITVWDTEGGLALSCDPLVITEVQTIDYPHYFTPNGDGIHDTWNIVGLQNQPTAKIYIFDRYGKLVKQISPAGEGWDGTYNGNLMLSTDYWFTVDYNEAAAIKQFKAHFALKR
jgi:gliding motility-associated-like protein